MRDITRFSLLGQILPPALNGLQTENRAGGGLGAGVTLQSEQAVRDTRPWEDGQGTPGDQDRRCERDSQWEELSNSATSVSEDGSFGHTDKACLALQVSKYRSFVKAGLGHLRTSNHRILSSSQSILRKEHALTPSLFPFSLTSSEDLQTRQETLGLTEQNERQSVNRGVGAGVRELLPLF